MLFSRRLSQGAMSYAVVSKLYQFGEYGLLEWLIVGTQLLTLRQYLIHRFPLTLLSLMAA
jgi:hypothetical protein